MNLEVSAAESRIMAKKKKNSKERATTHRRATLCQKKRGRKAEHSRCLWERNGLEVEQQEVEAELLLQGSPAKLRQIADFLFITKPSKLCIIQLYEIYATFIYFCGGD